MIAIFAYRLIKTDFLGGWKKSAGEYATGTSITTCGKNDQFHVNLNFVKKCLS